MPNENFISFMVKQVLHGTVKAESCARKLLDAYNVNPEDKKSSGDLRRLCTALAFEMQTKEMLDLSIRTGSIIHRSRRDWHMNDYDKSWLVVCCAWLDMPDICERIQKTMSQAIPESFFEELRYPIMRSGKFSQYQALLTATLSQKQNVTDVSSALDRLMDIAGGAGHDPQVLSWSRQMIETALDSSRTLMQEADACTLLGLCRRYGASMYTEWYVTPHILSR